VWRILNENEIKPHKIRYYLEKRDPEFDRKRSISAVPLSSGRAWCS
jgi:hypothetical protein